jgi:hypothetical protein
MMATDLKELKRLAEKCTVGDPWFDETSFGPKDIIGLSQDKKFIAAANPAAVLALIERLVIAEKIRSNGWIIHLSKWKERIDLIVDPKDRADMTELILKIDQAVMDMTARATPHLGRL